MENACTGAGEAICFAQSIDSELQAGIFPQWNFQLYAKSRRDFIGGSWIAVSN